MKTINPNAPVICADSILIHADSQKVWCVLTDIRRWPTWQSDISQASLYGSLEPGAAFAWKTGGLRIRSILHTVEPCSRLGWTGKTLGISAIHNWTLNAQDGKTLVVAEESMEGLLANLLKGSLHKNLVTSMRHWLELLKKESEKP